jgi:RNA-binding protein
VKTLSNAQLRFLKAKAQLLKPMLKVGKNGLSEAFVQMVETELTRHELVKIKFDDLKPEAKTLSRELANRVSAEMILQVGHVVTLYRANPDQATRKVQLPA